MNRRFSLRQGKWLLLFAVVLLGGLAVAVMRFVRPAPAPTPARAPTPALTSTPGDLFTVQRGQAAQDLELRGRVASVQEAFLFFPMEGWLKKVHAIPGQTVQQGDLLAELDAWELESEVIEAKHTLEMHRLEISRTLASAAPERVAVAQAQVEQAQVALDQAELDAAHSIGNTAQALALAQLQDASPDLISAEIRLERAKIALEDIQDQYTRALDRPWEESIIRDTLAKQVHDAQLDYRLAEAQVQEAKQHASERDLLVRHAREDLAREQELAQQKVSAASTDLALAKARLAQLVAPPRPEDLDILRARVSQAEVDLERLTARLAETHLYAPFDGTVLSLETQVGDRIQAYASVGTVGDPAEIQVLAFVFEDDLGALAYDPPVTVVLDNDLERTHPAHITEVASQPMTWQGKRAYQVAIAFDEPDEVPAVVRTGCDVILPSDRGVGSLVVPGDALRIVGDLTYVDVVTDGVVSPSIVQVGTMDGDLVEIVSGLREGQTVRVP